MWALEVFRVALYHGGIISGDGDGYLNPNKPITREEMYVLAERVMANTSMFHNQRYTPIPDENGMIAEIDREPYKALEYDDAGDVAPWAVLSLMELNTFADGILPRINSFEPKSYASRLEAAELVWRILQYDSQ